MNETEYTYTQFSENAGGDATVGGGPSDAGDAAQAPLLEKIVDDARVNINHIVVPPGAAVPTHVSNSWVHQIIVRGTLSLSLEDEPFQDHPAGTIVAVPFNQKMVIQNRGNQPLEFFVVKAPNPASMPKTKEI